MKQDVFDVSETVSHIKARVTSMVTERQANEGPSTAWSQVSGYFDYVRDMDPKYCTRLQLHTYHLTWDSYQPYLLADDAAVAAFQARWQRLVRNTPEELVAYEPEDGFGFPCGTGLVSIDVLRYQQTINTLYQQGVIDALRRRARRAMVLEIGPGYGGLTHHLASVLGRGDHGVTFVLIDLPEVRRVQPPVEPACSCSPVRTWHCTTRTRPCTSTTTRTSKRCWALTSSLRSTSPRYRTIGYRISGRFVSTSR